MLKKFINGFISGVLGVEAASWDISHNRLCVHEWDKYDNNAYKRKCSKCGRIEWMFGRKFPSLDQPSLSWKFMRYEK